MEKRYVTKTCQVVAINSIVESCKHSVSNAIIYNIKKAVHNPDFNAMQIYTGVSSEITESIINDNDYIRTVFMNNFDKIFPVIESHPTYVLREVSRLRKNGTANALSLLSNDASDSINKSFDEMFTSYKFDAVNLINSSGAWNEQTAKTLYKVINNDPLDSAEQKEFEKVLKYTGFTKEKFYEFLDSERKMPSR
jgi:hypothetical protein